MLVKTEKPTNGYFGVRRFTNNLQHFQSTALSH